jgi:hypothetical protein
MGENMSASKKQIILTVAVVVLGSLGWAWYELRNKPANERIQDGVRQIISKEPRVKPLYDQVMKDGVLTVLEANEIVDKANELKGVPYPPKE